MRGHHHSGDPSLTQNQGNTLGDRPCVRQSRLYREHVGGNVMKDIMGQTDLKWDTTQTQGVYAGGRVYDHNTNSPPAEDAIAQANAASASPDEPPRPLVAEDLHEVEITMDAVETPSPVAAAQGEAPAARQEGAALDEPPQGTAPLAGRAFRPGAGQANRQTYNIFTGE